MIACFSLFLLCEAFPSLIVLLFFSKKKKKKKACLVAFRCSSRWYCPYCTHMLTLIVMQNGSAPRRKPGEKKKRGALNAAPKKPKTDTPKARSQVHALYVCACVCVCVCVCVCCVAFLSRFAANSCLFFSYNKNNRELVLCVPPRPLAHPFVCMFVFFFPHLFVQCNSCHRAHWRERER